MLKPNKNFIKNEFLTEFFSRKANVSIKWTKLYQGSKDAVILLFMVDIYDNFYQLSDSDFRISWSDLKYQCLSSQLRMLSGGRILQIVGELFGCSWNAKFNLGYLGKFKTQTEFQFKKAKHWRYIFVWTKIITRLGLHSTYCPPEIKETLDPWFMNSLCRLRDIECFFLIIILLVQNIAGFICFLGAAYFVSSSTSLTQLDQRLSCIKRLLYTLLY